MNEGPPHCGPPRLDTGLLARRDPSGGAPALFAGREVAFAFNTRVAIRKAVDLLGLRPGDEVLAPAYNCGSELDPLRHAGLKVRLYPVSRQAEVDPEAVAALIGPRTRAVYLIHYFGFLQPQLAELRALCDRHGLFLLEDCALSLLSGAKPAEGRTGDVAFFCFYKFFPVIEGGALVANRPLDGEVALHRPAPAGRVGRAVLRAGAKRLLGPGALEWLRARRRGRADEPQPSTAGGLPDVPGHYYFDPALQERRISALTLRALRGQNVAEAIRRRRQNYRTLIGLLQDLPEVQPLQPELPADACPLNLPVLVPERDAIARRLQKEGIEATPWWAGYNRHLDWAGMEDARFLKDNLLALPVHQLLGPEHLQHIAARLHSILTGS